ncbi:axial filament protein [Mycobacterium tuberculosis]|nr:axial filament protein [Mycobacterium tuberculosis]
MVAKVPVHAPGEHPMFKAMAAGLSSLAGRGDEESGEPAAELAEQAGDQPPTDLDDTAQADFEDTEDTDEDEDELDADEDLDEDLDVEDSDSDDEDSDEDAADADVDEEDAAGLDGSPGEVDVPGVTELAPTRPRRRVAGRPAGPPIRLD